MAGSRVLLKKVAEFPEPDSALGQEFVLFDDCGHGHLALAGIVLDPHHTPFALHADTLRKGNFRRERERETNRRALLDG